MKKSLTWLTGTVLLVLSQMYVHAQKIEDAISLSHNGKYNAAEKIFSQLIASDEYNAGLLIAAGFNSAWAADYTTAKQRFLKAQQIAPANTDAFKGLSYTFLYEGSFKKAAAGFEKLLVANLLSEEFHMAAGLAYLNLHQRNKATLHFEAILRVNPANEEARQYLQEIKSTTGVIELSTLAGVSGSGGQSKFGLRQVQLGYQINPEILLFARYDNSLSLDNFFLIKNNFNVNTTGAGIYSKWHKYIGSKFEYAHRNLTEGITQNLWQTEQVIFLPENYVLKLGGSFITSNQLASEWMAMTSLSIPITEKIKTEPHYYFIKRLGVEHRVVLNTSYQFNPKNDIAFGLFFGTEKIAAINFKNTVAGGFAYSNFYVKGPLYGTALLRYEKDAAAARNAFIVAAGLKLRFNTKKSHQ
jgi:tetratricopeptide (TPR) repeat protein